MVTRQSMNDFFEHMCLPCELSELLQCLKLFSSEISSLQRVKSTNIPAQWKSGPVSVRSIKLFPKIQLNSLSLFQFSIQKNVRENELSFLEDYNLCIQICFTIGVCFNVNKNNTNILLSLSSGRAVTCSSLEWEVWSSDLGPIKSHAVLPTARHRCSSS